MYLFTKPDIDEILKSLDIKVEHGDGEKIIINPITSITAECESCKCKITTSNLGHIAHGSTKFYCNDAVCFSQLVACKKLW